MKKRTSSEAMLLGTAIADGAKVISNAMLAICRITNGHKKVKIEELHFVCLGGHYDSSFR